MIEISNHLFRVLRGTDNLIFANSRRLVETLADLLRRHCERNHVPVEFFPHHGSLSKEIREEAEDFIKDTTRPGNIVCTSTLELGIDIGSVNSIAQIGSPPSVASMRQRLGRSGRRKGESSILRLYAAENEITSRTHVVNTLRSQVIQSIAMVELLLSGWNEAPSDEVYHFSTLVQQTLSLIAQYGGVSAKDAWRILCQNGAFSNVDQKMYIAFLRALGVSDLLTQTHDGELVLGYNGEKLVEHFDFYAAFSTPDEYRLIAGQRVLGSIPVDFPLFVGLHLIFAGRRWQVDEIDDDSNTIYLHPYPGGIPPKFGGSGALISDEIRKKMFEIYEDSFVPQYLNKGAIQLLSEGRQNFKTLRLSERSIIQSGKHCYIFPWMGDRVMNTMLLQLTSLGLAVQMGDISLEVQNVSLAKLKSIIQTIPENLPLDADKLTKKVENLENEKHDHFLPDELLRLDYARRFLAIESSGKVFCKLANRLTEQDFG